MKVFLSIVSHGHEDLIKKLNMVDSVASLCTIVIKSNKQGDCYNDYSSKHKNFYWLNEKYHLGFGANNNYIYDYCRRCLDMNDDDLFIVVNPDVYITAESISEIIIKMKGSSVGIATINLFKDFCFEIHDPSIRHFPSFLTFVKSFLLKKNESIIDKSEIKTPITIDWAAGSFMAIKSSLYKDLNGFDEKYFMYCEDIDICLRSMSFGYPVWYFPNIKAVHLAQSESRSMLSKHFFWHLTSTFRFLYNKRLIKINRQRIKVD